MVINQIRINISMCIINIFFQINGIVYDSELLRHRSCDQKVPSSIPHSGISVDVTSQC